MNAKPEKFEAVPPPRKPAVKVDEATAPKKTLAEQVADATGSAAAKEAEKEAALHFAVPAVEVPVEIRHVRTEDVRPSPLNPRVDVDAGLLASVEQLGIITPLTVRETEEPEGKGAPYEVISGHRRLAAAKKAGREYVPVIVLDGVDDVRWLEVNAAEQINRRSLEPIEEAALCRKLIELAKYTPEQVAQKLGQSTSWVLKRVSLLTLAPEAQRALKKSEVPLTVAQGLAVLPSHGLQVKALEQAKHRLSQKWDTESILKEVRDNVARPLRDASWKLTDADLLPAAGACSTCPHNSSNNRMPGLFESGKAAPSCAKPDCYSEKQNAQWALVARKYEAAGAKRLSLTKSEELFRHGDVMHSETYVALDVPAPQDKAKRTWRELAEKANATPQVYVARDRDGKPRELYQRAAVAKAIADGLKLKWAMEPDADDVEPSGTPAKGKVNEEAQKQSRIEREARDSVQAQVLARVAKDIAAKGLTLADVRAALLDEEEQLDSPAFDRFCELLKMGPKEAKAFHKSATTQQLMALLWFSQARFSSWEDFHPQLVAVAEAHGLDTKKMFEAQLATAKAEALMGKAG